MLFIIENCINSPLSQHSRAKFCWTTPNSAVTNATSLVGYPVGRHLWLVKDPKCNLFTPTWVNLTLSR